MAKPNATVAHEWYHAQSDEAEGRGSSFFYEGNVIYSFGHHYPIARKVGGDRNLILFQYLNEWGGYTGRHRNHVHHAIAGNAEIFWVEDVMADDEKHHLWNHDNYFDRCRELADKWPRAREGKLTIFSQIQRIASEMNQYAIRFNLPVPRNMSVVDFLPMDWEDDLLAMRRIRDEKEARDKARWAEQERLRKLKYEEAIPRWRAGEGHTLYGQHGAPALLRLKGYNIETSQGAVVHTKYASAAWRLIQRCRRLQKEWHRNGDTLKLGIYQLDSVDAEGNIVAGCHRVEYEELRNMARQLNLPLAQLQEV